MTRYREMLAKNSAGQNPAIGSAARTPCRSGSRMALMMVPAGDEIGEVGGEGGGRPTGARALGAGSALCELAAPVARGLDRLDHGRPDAMPLQLADRVDGGARRRGDRLPQQHGMLP